MEGPYVEMRAKIELTKTECVLMWMMLDEEIDGAMHKVRQEPNVIISRGIQTWINKAQSIQELLTDALKSFNKDV
jgi:hypothetical protein